MRRVLDCRALRSPATDGISTYILGLVGAWAARPNATNDRFVCFDDAATLLEQVVPRSAIKVIRRAGRVPLVDAHVRDAQHLSGEGGLVYVLGGMSPLFFKSRFVQVVHDVLIYEHPEWFPSQPFATRLAFPRALKRADHIAAVSETTKHALDRLFSVGAKTTVVLPGLVPKDPLGDTHRLSAAFGIHRPYLLCLGTLEPRKNLPCALRAFAMAAESGMRDVDLVIVGDRGWKFRAMEQEIHSRQVTHPGRIHWLGSVTPQEKHALLSGALALLFPSFGEGLGYPPLEAAQYAVPSLVSDIPVMHETLGQAAVFLDPGDSAAWAKHIGELVRQPSGYRALGMEAQKNTARFSWERTVEGLMCLES